VFGEYCLIVFPAHPAFLQGSRYGRFRTGAQDASKVRFAQRKLLAISLLRFPGLRSAGLGKMLAWKNIASLRDDPTFQKRSRKNHPAPASDLSWSVAETRGDTPHLERSSGKPVEMVKWM